LSRDLCDHLEFMQYPIDDSVKALGRRWAGPVLMEILSGRDRFNTLLSSIRGINARTLAARLREFERLGLVKRKKRAPTSERAHYVLTEKGEAMSHLLRDIVSFSLKWHR